MLGKEIDHDLLVDDFDEKIQVCANLLFEDERLSIIGIIKLGGHKLKVKKYNGRNDYLLWKCQVKSDFGYPT